ncbi:hypothetical protein [Streptomyces sp. 11-1-2]|uniref:hypothetical protein n=1 Tax=unclassified Streptomyces TaxID=2593676 RepID=UPI000B8D304E|nr:hypothetical protein [Streptomyces sp. 11-1-2]ASQ91841.1 hypothetical protein CGL27_00220 [Streptomyces sp. 11-1-2]
MVRQAVRDVRTAPPPPPADPLADPALAAMRPVVDDLAASTHQLGELMLEVMVCMGLTVPDHHRGVSGKSALNRGKTLTSSADWS